jgi:hypothetical protein
MRPYYFCYRVGNVTHAGELWSSGREHVEAMIKRVHSHAYRITIWRA